MVIRSPTTKRRWRCLMFLCGDFGIIFGRVEGGGLGRRGAVITIVAKVTLVRINQGTAAASMAKEPSGGATQAMINNDLLAATQAPSLPERIQLSAMAMTKPAKPADNSAGRGGIEGNTR